MSRITYLFLLINTLFSISIYAEGKPQILEADINFYPRIGGSFKSGSLLSYYVLGNRNIITLNEYFKISGNISLSPGASVIDFGDINGDSYDDLVEIRRNELIVRYQTSEKNFLNPQKLIAGNYMSPPGTSLIEQFKFLKDIDDDGYAEMLIPSDYNYVFLENRRGTLVQAGFVDCPYESNYSDRYWRNSDLRANRISVKTFIPSVYFQDINHDGVSDAYCRFKSLVYFYLSQNDSRGRLKAFSQRIVKSYPANLQGEYASDFFLEDMNSDSHTDAVFSVVSGLGLKIKTEVQIFWGKENVPDSTDSEKWTETGGFFNPLLMNNNGQKQLLIPTLNLGVSFFLSYILEKKMQIEGNIYRFNSNKFEKLNSHKLGFMVIDNLFPGFSVGDFNSDGISDVALAKDIKELILLYGDKNMTGDNSLILPLPGYGILDTIDQGKGNNELLIYLPQVLPGLDSKKIYLVRFH